MVCFSSLNKTSRSSRAYLHLTQPALVNQLAQKLSLTAFEDAAGTVRDASLIGPPSLELAPYGRVPNNKSRKDQRQGTIDQDPEFISFLESLTNPTTKLGEADQESELTTKAKEKVTSTPLIDFLREKKANKGKDLAPAKSSKHGRQEPKDSKAATTTEKKPNTKAASNPSGDNRTVQAIKVENAAREATRMSNKPAAAAKSNDPTGRAASTAIHPSKASALNPLADKKRERGVASAAAKILQRDLGLAGARGGRGSRRNGPVPPGLKEEAQGIHASAEATQAQPVLNHSASQVESRPSPSAQLASSDPTVLPGSPKVPAKAPPTGPSRGRTQNPPPPNKPVAVPPTAPKAASKSQISLADPSSKQAFLKHANPSQGVTEPLLEEAFAAYGTVEKVEIDKKKGFAYIDFADSQGLLHALKASPVTIGQGQVVVLERRVGPNMAMRNARGGGPKPSPRGGPGHMMRGGRGGSVGRGGRPRAPLPPAHANPSDSVQAANVSTISTISTSIDPLAAASTAAISSGSTNPTQHTSADDT